MRSSDMEVFNQVPNKLTRSKSGVSLNVGSQLHRTNDYVDQQTCVQLCGYGVQRLRSRSASELPSFERIERFSSQSESGAESNDRYSSGQNAMRRVDDLEVVIGGTGELSEKRAATELGKGDSVVVQRHPRKMRSSVKLIIYASGILISYAVFGIFQEKILRGRYGPEQERFDFPFVLLFMQCLVSSVLAKILLTTIWKQGRDSTTYAYYASTAFFYMLAMLTSTVALKYVNYPTQVVAKSCKPIPVMLLGVLLARKRYSVLKYCFVAMIVIGVATFIYKNDRAGDQESSMFGNVFLSISLISDGLIAALQDRMRQSHQTKSLHMMSQLNFFSVVYVVIAIVYTGELPLFLSFVQRHPRVYGELALFAVCSGVGQIFIYSTVAEFGPLVCSIITTTRKFFTVLGSVLLFGNYLSHQQWVGTAFVFAGLFLDAFYGKSAHSAKKA